MKTKLVYVLTCAEEDTYIEQALISVWSARYWNPDATIVLIVDDNTDSLLAGKRGELLNYVSEKIVVPFEDAILTPMYRSRFIKTQVRELVKGDLLFIDCDTICCRSLSDIDSFECEIGAANDNNLLFQQDRYKEDTINKVAALCDISKEEHYFSSGVLYCKDTENTRKLYTLWHTYWMEGVELGINIDQPALAKANIELDYIITPIDDVYNCVLYTQNEYLAQAAILHISNFPQTSFLFKPNVFAVVREQGITPWIAELILRVHATYLPYDYSIKHSSCAQRKQWIQDIAFAAKMYGRYVDAKYSEWIFRADIESVIGKLFRCHLYGIGAFVWIEYQHARLARKINLRANICEIEA